MATNKYKCPPTPSSGAGTFSDELVGYQLVTGGGLTQANFTWTTYITEKSNIDFYIGAFSDPISLDTLEINGILESKAIQAKEFRVYPNFDLSEVSRFTLFGPLTNRLSASVQKIINYFPAALEINSLMINANSGYTATDCVYYGGENLTTLNIDISMIRNPFNVDFSVNSTRNLSLSEYTVSPLRNLSKEYPKYSLYVNGEEYPLNYLSATTSLYSGTLQIVVFGNPFSGQDKTTDYLIIRPNDFYSDKSFIEPLDEVEQFLMNRLITPIYTAQFKIPKLTEDGQTYVDYESVTWPLNGRWNIDIQTLAYTNYIEKLAAIGEEFDSFRTNLVSRFLTTQAFKDFDTSDQRMQKILNIYGRSFDEVKKFIDTLAFMNSVNYVVKDDIPSQLLKNLSDTLGWKINISPITNENFLGSVFGNTNQIEYPGFSRANTPTELNYQFYRNLILNSSYLFKSKGTRKSIEFLMRLVGAPDAIVEFNETIYIAGNRININDFEEQYAQISGGTYTQELPVLDTGFTYTILGDRFTGFTSTTITEDAYATISDYPIDSEGYPYAVEPTEDYFFQKGAGWFELTPQHQSPLVVDRTNSVFTGENFNIQTYFEPFTYGQKYLERYRKFPYMQLGFDIIQTIDNKKSWPVTDVGIRIGTPLANYDAYYFVQTEKRVINVKNVDLFLNPAQGLCYDVWYMSTKYDYPIPSTGLTSPYPQPGGVDWTYINPQPSKKTFFEFAQTFWHNMINTRNRMYSTDGKTSGYPTLQSIYWMYLQSDVKVGIPNDNYTYRTMVDYVTGLGDYWIRLVEQMIPATTIWNGGTKFENSIFHRQKFVWRYQPGCEILPVPCEICYANGSIFPNTCVDETISCYVYPWDKTSSTVTSFSDVLNILLNNYLIANSLTLETCDPNTLTSYWYLDFNLNGNSIVHELIYTGYGVTDKPSNSTWLSALQTYLPEALNNQGLGIIFDNATNKPTFEIYNLGCDPQFFGNTIQLNIGVDFSIICN